MKGIIFILSIITYLNLQASSHNVDSLRQVWKDTSQADTNRLKAINEFTYKAYLFSQPDSAFYFANLQYEFSLKANNTKYMSNALNTLGIASSMRGYYMKAIEYYTKCLTLNKKINNKRGIASSLNNIGLVYKNQGNYSKALDFFTNSLEIKREIGDKRGIASSLNNIGLIYILQDEVSIAIDYYSKSMALYEETGERQGVAAIFGNLGKIYSKQSQYEKAISSFNKSIKIYEDIGNIKGLAEVLNDIGIVYLDQQKYRMSLDCLFRALKMKKKVKEKKGTVTSLYRICKVYLAINNTKQALIYGNDALIIAKELLLYDEIDDISKTLYEIYKKKGDSEKALSFYELYVFAKDTLDKQNAREQSIKLETKRRYDKHKLEDSLIHLKHLDVKNEHINTQNEKLKNEKILRYSFLIGMLIVLTSLIIIIKNLKKTRKQKLIIEKQHNKLDEVHRGLTSSINYAYRIQESILPDERLFKDNFSNYFILHKPKDVVGGDFYWFKKFEDISIIATVDCTGHGVPGGFMSMMGSLLLDKIINKANLDTSEILIKLNNEIIRVLNQELGGVIQDGMDLALCLIDKKSNKIHFSGARNSIIIISEDNVNLFDAEIIPVGGSFSSKSKIMKRTYKKNIIPYKQGDWLFMFTDGYYDQLSKQTMRSLGMNRFKNILLKSIEHTNKEEYLLLEFNKWRSSFSQIDDICIIGLEL